MGGVRDHYAFKTGQRIVQRAVTTMWHTAKIIQPCGKFAWLKHLRSFNDCPTPCAKGSCAHVANSQDHPKAGPELKDPCSCPTVFSIRA